MSGTNRQGGETRNPCFQGYYESFYKGLHEWRDYEKVSMGHAEWYYDCLPSNREAKILDIGCGDGKFLFFLRRNGYVRAEGLELSPCLADIAGKRVGCPVHVVDDAINFLSLDRGRYDTVSMNDVLEHIPKEDMIHFLSVVKEALVP
jgi:2-polyprenyl-3-methyl-5-hydroxy-6-metoxy-1,4-benzoquinol methylase